MKNYYSKHFGILKTIKGIYFYNYRLLRRRFLDSSSDKILEINGHKFSIIPNDKGISEELLMFKTHEPLSTSILKNLLKDGMVCLDIGSNIGYYACLESNKVGEKGKVLSIEPSPINFKYLLKNIDLQKWKNIETYNFACGEADGEVTFAVSDRSNWSRVMSNEMIDVPEDKILNQIKVPMRKIDSILNEKKLTKLDFVRMDVEGYELNILEGMKETIAKFSPLIHMEVHLMFLGQERIKKLFKNLKNMGYEILYYIPREMDVPILGTANDIKKLSFNDLFTRIEMNKLPMNFLLFLQKTS